MCRSICEECSNYCRKNVIITGINTGEPAEEWCEEDSENFMTDDGCYQFDRYIDEDID